MADFGYCLLSFQDFKNLQSECYRVSGGSSRDDSPAFLRRGSGEQAAFGYERVLESVKTGEFTAFRQIYLAEYQSRCCADGRKRAALSGEE